MTPIFHTHRHIGVDIDETIASTMTGLVDFAHSIGELEHIESIEDIKKHDASGLRSDMTIEESHKLWEGYGHASMDPMSIPVVPGALEGMKKLYAVGKEISIITARSDKEDWKVARTMNWMRTHFPFVLEDRIHFVNHYSADALPKSHVCQALGVTLMIDDALENAYELCQSGITSVLIERPWNRDVAFTHPLLYRVKDWHEILQHLE